MRAGKKGQYELMHLIMEVIIIVVGLFVILSLIRTMYQPDRQIAFANAELLRIAIDDVCASSNDKTLEFNFPQPAIATVVASNFVSRFQIRAKIDPDYLLYYEAFPPGEAEGWEAFLDLPTRAVIALPGTSIPNSAEYLKTISDLMAAKRNVSAVVFSNVLLSNDSLTGNIGHWEGDVYKFDNASSLSTLDMSLVKYRACGPYSLCLKTRDGIYRLPLPNCERKGISLIQLTGGRNDYTDRSDFYLASPCKATVTIKKGSCLCEDTSQELGTSNAYAMRGTYILKPADDALVSEKSRVDCWGRFTGSPDDDAGANVDNCIEVNLDSRDWFCRTSNYERNFFGFGYMTGLVEIAARYFTLSGIQGVIMDKQPAGYTPSPLSSVLVSGFWPTN